MARFDRQNCDDLCGDEDLGYLRCRTPFVAGSGLVLDEAYRLAHLPLVAADHPSVISQRVGTHYNRGRHEQIFSLVLPIAAEVLLASPAYVALEQDLRAACFAPKIAWDLLEKRQDKLHATICGSLGRDEMPVLGEAEREKLAELGPLHAEVRGLFSGNVNVGRLYLRVYPEKRDGENMYQAIQRILGRPKSDLYLVGLFNFTDHLDANEAAALERILAAWWERPLCHIEAEHLWLMGASDDLVLDGVVGDTIRLT